MQETILQPPNKRGEVIIVRRSSALALLIFWLIGYPAQARAASWWPFGRDGMEYRITIDGADAEMNLWLQSLKLDQPTEVNPPHNAEELEQEANGLAGRVEKALQAKGYAEAQVDVDVKGEAKPPVVRLEVMQGTRYPVRAIRFEWPGTPLRELDPASLQSAVDRPVDMEAIEADAVTLQKLIAKDACLLFLIVTPKLRLDSRRQTAELVFRIAHGSAANFGPVEISGNPQVKDKVIERSIAWKQGECFDAAKVERTRSSLIQNQLFSSVEVEVAETPDADGRAPVIITVKERAARTVSAGAEYSTDQGFGLQTGWEHRNFFGGAEKFNAGLTLAERKQGVRAQLRLPAFLRSDQVLALSTSLTAENTDAYESLTFDGSAMLERRLSDKLKGGLGIGYTLTHTEDVLTGENDYALLSLPSFLEYDSRDSSTDARKGMMGRLTATPYTETIGEGGQFLKLQGTGYHYLSSDTMTFKPTLATRLTVGSISGGKGDDVPASIRYYAGGGGSVRGYSYQSLAPQFNGQPVGGSSLVEGAVETRLRFTETIGGVVFLDFGNAYASTLPDVGEKLYYGAGVGARYYSAIGPLRLDIGFPLNGKDINQTGYAFYVSLGQAF